MYGASDSNLPLEQLEEELIIFINGSYLVHGGDKPGGVRCLGLESAPGAAGGGAYNLHK